MASFGLKIRLPTQAEFFCRVVTGLMEPRSAKIEGNSGIFQIVSCRTSEKGGEAFNERIGKADNLCIGGSCADIHKHAPLRTQMRELRRRVRSEIVLSISSAQNAGRPC
jgi:hypothetical protein